MREETFSQTTLEEGAAALNRVFEDYFLPITFSAEQLRLHMTYYDVDAASSPIWYDERGDVVAASLLAVRESRGWVGGFGVAPAYRGRGYARTLIEHMIESAPERGLRSITLEVLYQNAAAIAVYGKVGFQMTRRLVSFETLTERAAMPGGFFSIAPELLIEEDESAPPCWQREQASLRNGAVTGAVTDGNGSDALFRSNSSHAQVLKIAAQNAQSLSPVAQALSAGSERQSVLLLNEPEESRLIGYARESGWNERVRQYEMRIDV